MASNLRDCFELRADIESEPGPLLSKALADIARAEVKGGATDITAIGAINPSGYPEFEDQDGIPRDTALAISDSKIRVIQNCSINTEGWDAGWVGGPGPDDETEYLISHGPIVMVQTFALPILHLATCGRVTPLRLWRLAMHKGMSMKHFDEPGIPGVHYGEVHEHRYTELYDERLPPHFLEVDEIVTLEELGDVGSIKSTIVHRGGFWMWMRPDNFPLKAKSEPLSPSLTSPPATPGFSAGPTSALENLPFELLRMIALEGPLSSLLSLTLTSRTLRSKYFHSEEGRNNIARMWIQRQAPWYIPATTDAEAQFELDGLRNVGAWGYLQRCYASASMRNRRRIWQVAERIEQLAGADKIGSSVFTTH